MKLAKTHYFLLMFGTLTVVSAVFIVDHYRSRFSLEPSVTASDDYQIISRSCWFDIPSGESIDCGELRTPASSGAFTLPFVIIHDASVDRRPDPLVYLRGGPGASMELDADGIEYWLSWRGYTGLKRDLILLEPRGVGRSKPALACAAFDKFSLSVAALDTELADELAQGYKILSECFNNLSVAPHAFSIDHYGTSLHAQDLQALMTQLDYSQWNLLGVSYGTRVALEVANHFDKVRSVILDSVYPAWQGGVQSFPAVLDNAFINFFNWCSAAPECAMGEPIQKKLFYALDELKKRPISLTVPRYNGELPVEFLLNDHRFVSVIFAALYSKHQWEKIPLAIDSVIARDAQSLLPMVTPFINNAFAEDFSVLSFLAVDCSDHPVSLESDYQQALKDYPLLAEYTRDLWRYQACHFLGKDVSARVPKTELPRVPALILAGDLDPITPVEWAEELAQGWPEAQLQIFRNTGHAIINSDDCATQLLREFLDNPQEPVASCKSSIRESSRD